MTTHRLPIDGHPHLFLASQDDEGIVRRTMAELRAAGFTIAPDRIIPPKDAQQRDVISAITAAFQKAKT